MLAHLLADLRDGQRRLSQYQQHAIGLDRPRDMDWLAITVGQIDHRASPCEAPCCSTHRANVKKVAHADAAICSLRAPARTNPSSQVSTRIHLAEVASASPTKNDAPLSLSTPVSYTHLRAHET